MTGPRDRSSPMTGRPTDDDAYCTGCGRPTADCPGCGRALDPPRFCPDCGRRMTVTVVPTGWVARCRDDAHRQLRST